MRTRFHIVLATLLLAFQLVCAQNTQDSVATDTLRNKYLPTGIRVGYDLLAFGRTRFQDNFQGWEIQGDADFDRYYLAVEYGSWGRNLNSDSARYANTGNYWRAGVDVNFLTTDPDRNMFFLGGRYGRSNYTESMSITRYDPVWGLMADNFYHSGVRAHWIELTTGLRVKIWKIVWLGYTARFKFGLSAKGSSEMLSHDIPGFGSTDKETTWGFNYYLMIRLPVRKAPPVAVSK